MALGLCRLRLSPDAFWAMTPRELAAASGRLTRGADAPSRAAFEALLARFPDG